MIKANAQKTFYLQGLGLWNLYFFVKFYLHLEQSIQLDITANLALACFLSVNTRIIWLQKCKQCFAVVFALSLLYSESWLPPLSQISDNIKLLSNFSWSYFVELGGRFISLELIYAAIIGFVGYHYLSRWLRLTSFSFAGLLWLEAQALMPASMQQPDLFVEQKTQPQKKRMTTEQDLNEEASSPEQQLLQFYQHQQNYPAQVPQNNVNFDVLLLNICSLSYDDLTAAGIESSSLFDSFDIVFKQFNTATSYSGPAALRLLRASCGHVPHADLFEQGPKACYLFENLKSLGFKTSLVMNHDGHFDNFLGLIQNEGHVDAAPLPLAGREIEQYAFDNTPVYDDADMLKQWLKQVNASPQPQALYYNTVSLHDGNRLVAAGKLDAVTSYARRSKNLFADLKQFLADLAASGRNVMVVLVPEHGAALKGDKMQFSGLRDIPSPSIVNVPAAVKFIGPSAGYQNQAQVVVAELASHYTLGTLIKRAIDFDVFANPLNLNELVADLPDNRLVAENKGAVLLDYKGKPYIKLAGDDWLVYPGY
ncbi:cellulose biosynthesis protein BcsG [Gayadomonas joobiniege]|uniref:cellulose biosynthesis protein BcsG n=1 Tax=Gayadomonas joobiniege TaxID=1234606 RepID=UPI0003826821|nr:cellulose biosynthesis protein BcsG [Gayadomonas joobiniege]